MFNVPKTGKSAIRFLGAYKGTLTHFQAGKTVPCLGEYDCPSPVHRLKLVWKAYAPVHYWRQQFRDWLPAVLEITERLEDLILGLTLRGTVWDLWRQAAEGKCQEVWGEQIGEVSESLLGPEFDVLPTVQRVIGRAIPLWGVSNPKPRRVIVEPVLGEAPPGYGEPVIDEAEAQKRRDMMEKMRKTFRTKG
jgi:hypothetical protein